MSSLEIRNTFVPTKRAAVSSRVKSQPRSFAEESFLIRRCLSLSSHVIDANRRVDLNSRVLFPAFAFPATLDTPQVQEIHFHTFLSRGSDEILIRNFGCSTFRKPSTRPQFAFFLSQAKCARTRVRVRFFLVSRRADLCHCYTFWEHKLLCHFLRRRKIVRGDVFPLECLRGKRLRGRCQTQTRATPVSSRHQVRRNY